MAPFGVKIVPRPFSDKETDCAWDMGRIDQIPPKVCPKARTIKPMYLVILLTKVMVMGADLFRLVVFSPFVICSGNVS